MTEDVKILTGRNSAAGKVMTAVIILSVLFLFALTLLRVEPGWCVSYKWFAFVNVIICLSACARIFIERRRMRIHTADMVIAGWYAYVLANSYFFSDFPSGSIILKTSLLLSAYISLRMLTMHSARCGFYISCCLISVTIAEAVIGAGQLVSGHSHHLRYAITGSFFNPGPCGTMLSLGVVMLAALWKEYGESMERKRMGKYTVLVSGALMALLVMTLAATLARAAWVATLVGVSFVYRREILRNKKIVAAVIAALAVFSISVYFLKRGSADGRMLIWSLCADSICQQPLTGSGTGSFFHTFSEAMRRLSATLPDGQPANAGTLDYAMNFFFLIGVEQGIVGLLFALSLSVILLRRSWEERTPMACVFPVLIVTSLFSYTFELMPFQIISVVAAAYLVTSHAECGNMSESERGINESCLAGCLSALLCIIVIPGIHRRVEATEQYRSMSGFALSSEIPQLHSLLPYLDDNKDYLFEYGKLLRESGHHDESTRILQKGELISNDPMFLVLTGRNFEDKGNYLLAERYYLRAYGMLPNRVYPLYRLMKMQQNVKEGEVGCLSTALRIVNFPVKVDSKAMRDMKREAAMLLKGA